MTPRNEEVWIQADGTVRYLEYSGFKLEVPGEKKLTRVSRIVERDGQHRVIDEATGRDLGGFPSREAALDFERKHYALNEKCSECGTRFHCAMIEPAAAEPPCWCAAYPAVKCDAKAKSCLCPGCLAKRAK